MRKIIPERNLKAFKNSVDSINKTSIIIDGKEFTPSQCYHLETEPLSVLFNTNCPDSLRKTLEDLILQYGIDINEERAKAI